MNLIKKKRKKECIKYASMAAKIKLWFKNKRNTNRGEEPLGWLVLNNSSSRRTCSYLQWRLARESRIAPRSLCSVKLENENRNGSLNNWMIFTTIGSVNVVRTTQKQGDQCIPILNRRTLLSRFYLVNQKQLWITRMYSYI